MSGGRVVLGGGRLGAAIARASPGGPVRILSRTPAPHAGLWLRWAAGDPLPPVTDAHVCVALAPGPKEDVRALYTEVAPRLVLDAWRAGAARVTLCGPAGRGSPQTDAFAAGLERIAAAPRTVTLRFSPLFGLDDRCVWPLVRAIREHGTARIPRDVPEARWLWLDDAARAVVQLDAGNHTLAGPERLGLDTIADRVVARFGGTWARHLWGRAPCHDALAAAADAPDEWRALPLAERTTVGAWVAKLPGLRRQR